MNIVENIFNKYGLSNEEKSEILETIYPIFMHPEFQKRLGREFLHHSDISLGEHILEDAIMTYKLSKKYLKKSNNRIIRKFFKANKIQSHNYLRNYDDVIK